MVDARLVPLALAIWAAAGVSPVIPSGWVFGAAAALLAAVTVVLVVRRRLVRGGDERRARSLAAVAVVLLGLATAGVTATLHVAASRAGPVPELAADGATAEVELTVDLDPLPRAGPDGRPGYVVFRATIRRLSVDGVDHVVRTPVVVTGSLAWRAVTPGQLVQSRGRFAPTERGEQPAAVVAMRTEPTVLAEAGAVQCAATNLRAGLREASSGLGPAERGLVPGLVVGDVSGLLPELADAFETTNLTHLVAVSGTNLTIVLAFVLGAARWIGLRSWVIPVLGVTCVAGFVIVARPEPSVLRAAAMGLVALAGVAAGTRRHGIPALALAIIGLVLIDPWLARAYGFALSVLATAGILILGPPCVDALSTRLPRWAAAAVTIPIVAQIPVIPVIAVLSESISVVSIVANLLAGLVVAPTTIAGVGATLLAPVSMSLAAAAAHVAGLGAWWIIKVATYGARLPGAELGWPVSPASVALLAVCSLLAAVLVPTILRRRLLSAGLAVGLVAWLVTPIPLPDPTRWLAGWPPKDWAVIACDVGQGDALVLRVDRDSGVVIDTGVAPDAVDRCLQDIGIRHVPYLLLTHYDADHIGGLSGVLRGRQVDEIAVTPVGADTERAADVRAAAAAAGAEVSYPAAGGEYTVGAVAWEVLWPPPGRESVVGDNTGGNDASVVIRADVAGVRILLTGDVEPIAQRAILRAGADLRADVVKVAHHGAADQEPAFVAASDAKVAVISAGVDNDYGHPAPVTMRLLRSLDLTILRTDRQGALAVLSTDDGLATAHQGR